MTAHGGSFDSPAMATVRPDHHAHAVLHCNANTVSVPHAATVFMALLGLEPRMHSVSTDSDATAMGLGPSTASTTSFLYDGRGPRAAPALELVEWVAPQTEPAAPDHLPAGFTALGLRVASLRTVRRRCRAAGQAVEECPDGLRVRGAVRPAFVFTGPDGIVVEVVEVPTSEAGVALSHERMRSTDLDRTAAWYCGIGWEVVARDAGGMSLALPEDPTFSLEFVLAPAAPGRPRAANVQGLYRVALAVDDVVAARRSLAASGAHPHVPEPVVIPMPDVPTGGFTVLFLADPDGSVVELVERPRDQVRRPAEPR
ncbi:MAG: hypothetical protein QOG20_5408 [Pseudonocardiales bacterium]|nr:hypothetical protein [Pseudonocardiales bacterium]